MVSANKSRRCGNSTVSQRPLGVPLHSSTGKRMLAVGAVQGDSERALQWRHNDHDGVSNHQPHDCLLKRLFRHRSKKTSKLRVTGLCAGNSPRTGEVPAQMASNAENVSIWWRHHVLRLCMSVETQPLLRYYFYYFISLYLISMYFISNIVLMNIILNVSYIYIYIYHCFYHFFNVLLYVCFMYHYFVPLFICIYVYLFIYLFIENRGLANWWC